MAPGSWLWQRKHAVISMKSSCPVLSSFGRRIDVDERDPLLVVRDAVVAHGAVNLVLLVDLMIDEDALGRGGDTVVRVALRALRGGHVLPIHRQMRLTVERDLVVARGRQIQLAESLDLVQHEGHGSALAGM